MKKYNIQYMGETKMIEIRVEMSQLLGFQNSLKDVEKNMREKIQEENSIGEEKRRNPNFAVILGKFICDIL
ncbi:hypothetical protein C922_05767 [Plasmodium inui San Antonio 1]|uniref:Uncharacterized protein n=1 Tax=Plasmodium inui San Antonio 1 TaxID=1237626 RepID=W7AEZ6_9APIC|nr:hypothetical protein C922_05767 [Plasmodium inui San Antonio 1]EUD63851.1 hypothetical protein C922_05767 [Plasmodium inui San Antonio 1]